MKTINIAPHIEELNVFDDPEYCESNEDECPRLLSDENKRICGVYPDGAIYDFNIDQKTVRIKKCDQCKEAYQKAKKKRMISFNILPLGTRFKYREYEQVFVKIDFNTVAKWDSFQIENNWVGQSVMSAFETEAELQTKVEVIEYCKTDKKEERI